MKGLYHCVPGIYYQTAERLYHYYRIYDLSNEPSAAVTPKNLSIMCWSLDLITQPGSLRVWGLTSVVSKSSLLTHCRPLEGPFRNIGASRERRRRHDDGFANHSESQPIWARFQCPSGVIHSEVVSRLLRIRTLALTTKAACPYPPQGSQPYE